MRALLVFLLFFVSGFCGLLYQVVWMRLAFASFGVITPVLTVVLSVFMAGLSIGSWAGGRWIEPWVARTGRSAILFYAIAELAIGIGAFTVPALFAFGEILIRPAGEIASATYLLTSAMVIALAILPSCVFMGTTFPFMTAYIKEHDRNTASGFSYLYLANVMGAMGGVLLTAIVLIESWGFRQTLLLAALLNAAIGLVALLLSLGPRSTNKDSGARPEMPILKTEELSVEGHGSGPPFSSGTVYLLLFLTGFLSMAMEVVWTRAYTPILRTTIYAFASLLAVYLLATWLGTVLHRLLLRRNRSLPYDAVLGFLAVTAALPLLLPDPRLWPEKWVALASIVPFCAALGYLTPKLIDEHSSGFPESVGRAYAFNIFGSILGPLCAGYLLLPLVGAKWSLVALVLPLVAFAWYSLRTKGVRVISVPIAIASVLILGYVSWKSSTFEDGSLYPRSVVRRDHTATVISTEERGRQKLLVNGVGITHKTPITKMMAHLPLAMREGRADDTLVICLGMGTTLRSMSSWGVRVTAVELVPSVVDAFGYYFDDAEEVLNRSNVDVVIDDGRRFLRRTKRTFDVVTIDPPPPVETAGSSLLYSFEFYELLKTRMSDYGILQQWFPGGEDAILRGVAGALVEAFPYVRVYQSYEGWGFHFLASMNPLPKKTAEELVASLPPLARSDLLEWIPEGQLPQLFYRTLHNEIQVPRILPFKAGVWISDDRPLNEYYLLRRHWAAKK